MGINIINNNNTVLLAQQYKKYIKANVNIKQKYGYISIIYYKINNKKIHNLWNANWSIDP